MAKLKISDYSSTSAGANLNTDINSINIDEGCAPSGINNAIRTLMAQLKDFQTGVTGDSLTLGGALSGTSATFSGDITASAISGASMTLSGDLTVDTNTLYVDSTNNTVGIGTSSPTTNVTISPSGIANGLDLAVDPSSSVRSGRIFFSNGTSGQAVALRNDTGGLAFSTGALAGFSSGTERMRMDSSGNLGIGTTSPAQLLHIDSTGAIKTRLQRSSNYSDISIGSSGELNFDNLSSSGFGWYINSSEKMRIDSSGNVGIGISSISRGELQINAVSGATELHMTNTGTGTGSTDGFTLFMTEDGDGAGVWLREAEALRFATAASERMRIDSTGDVGIGTTTPAYKFDIYENTTTYTARIFNDGNDANRRGLIIRCGSDTGAGTNVPVTFQDGDGTTLGSITFTGGTITYGTFTAWHPCVLPEGVTEYPYGTLLEIVSTYSYEKEGADYKQAIRYNVQKTQAENSKAVLGVYAGSLKDIFEDEPNLHQAYVLGDGHILCNNSGGDIKIGDGICSSSVAGIGKKATINPSMIIGIAQENVTFANSEETKLVAVQYGLQQFTPWVD